MRCRPRFFASRADMRTLNIALVVTGILISVVAASNKIVDAGTHASNELHHPAVVYGLHVALPDDMKAFPAELVPLP